MKITNIHSLLIWLSICIISCEKPNNAVADPNNIPGLPPATQSGANTFGCLVNGVPWVPAGFSGVANLSIDYDQGISNGIFTISAMRTISSSNVSVIGLGIGSQLNILQTPFELSIASGSDYFARHSFVTSCTINSLDTNVYSNGKIFLDVHDKTRRIIAGRFDVILYKIGCDTIKITKGRFDFKF